MHIGDKVCPKPHLEEREVRVIRQDLVCELDLQSITCLI